MTITQLRLQIRFAVVVNGLLMATLLSRFALGEEPDGKRKQQTQVDATSGITAVTVDALVDHNPTPTIANNISVWFDSGFNWGEYNRAFSSIPPIVKNAERLWPELVQHLDDDRYCTTLESVSGSPGNWTVGEMCREIVGRNLSIAYYRHLKPHTKQAYRMSMPGFLMGEPKVAKAWCEKRKGNQLYELQIEACGWAISELQKPDQAVSSSSEQVKDWVAVIEAEMKSLQESKKPIVFRGFGDEEYSRYHPKSQ